MKKRVLFISPRLGDAGKFHAVAFDFMKIAAESLGVDLSGLDATSVERTNDELQELLDGPEAPHGAVIVNSKNMATEVLERLDEAHVHTVLAYEGFYETDRPRVGEPGSPHVFWRAEILPDDLEVGRLLAKTLLDRAVAEKRHGADGTIRVLVLSGPFTQAATHRLTGFREAARTLGEKLVYDLRMADWSERKGHRLTLEYLGSQRPQVIWAANDSIARGAAQAVEQAGLEPGRDVLIGGVDWVGDALEKVADGRFATSVGGHILDGVWGLVLAHDAIAGHAPPVPRRLQSSIVAATAENAGTYRRLVDASHLRTIDFAAGFSRRDGNYDFSLERVLE